MTPIRDRSAGRLAGAEFALRGWHGIGVVIGAVAAAGVHGDPFMTAGAMPIPAPSLLAAAAASGIPAGSRGRFPRTVPAPPPEPEWAPIFPITPPVP